MTHLKEVLIDEGIKIGINTRIGSFLNEQRKLKGLSVRTVARKMEIKRSDLKKWEEGKSSPPCYLYFKLVSYYGKDAYRLASELDLQLQLEKYQRTIEQQKSKQRQPRKIPAVIWEEYRQDKLAS